MHRAGLRTALVTLLVLSSLLVYSAAYCDSLEYLGDLRNRDDYQSSLSNLTWDGELWDYVYQINDWNSINTPAWAIVATPDIVAHWEPAGWTYTWYNHIGTYGSTKIDELDGMSGIVWSYSGEPGTGAPVFHFQSRTGPAIVPYDGDGWSGQSTISNAAPEPASFALTALTLAGIAGWRRRRTAK